MATVSDDVEQIRHLIHRYAELLDEGDLDGVAALFEHSTYRSPGRRGALRGTEQIRRVYDGVILYEDGTPGTKHVISNVSIVCDSTEVAAARSYFTVLQAVPGLPLQPIIAGRYHDEFARIDDEWCFTDRLVIPELVGDLSHHMRPGSGAPPTSSGPTEP
jgi:hypothetical protein